MTEPAEYGEHVHTDLIHPSVVDQPELFYYSDLPELSTDVFVPVFEQQDRRLVDLDGPAVSSGGSGVVNVCLDETR